MRLAFVLVLVGCTTATPHPDPCPNCNPQHCPDPSQVIPNATCTVVPLVCPTPCGMKCQCWLDDAGDTVWRSTTDCDAGDAGEAGDAASDATDAGDAD